MITALGVALLALFGFAGAVAIECLQRPRALPLTRRRTPAVVAHATLWLALFFALNLILGRPGFALATGWTLWLALVMVNNAKGRVLREPFLFDDYYYFLDAIRHPRLFLPFLGWTRALGIVVIVAVVLVGGWQLEPPWGRDAEALLASALLFIASSWVLFLSARRGAAELRFRPGVDHRRHGLFGHLAFLAGARRRVPEPRMPWRQSRSPPPSGQALPHVVVVQSESFFDPREHLPGVRPEVLSHFDRLARAGVAGTLDVPAFGANTVRSEFAFLSGLAGADLGYRQFSPYRFVRPGFLDASLARVFRDAGYRTVCVHPYHGGFYHRATVMPVLGFDEFLDLSTFPGASDAGPYVSDATVADWVIERLHRSAEPLFLFVITMENHGPLHLETPGANEAEAYFVAQHREIDSDTTIYLRHLVNADRMLGRLAHALGQGARPGALCWFGDHPPILPAAYDAHGYPGRRTNYLLWATERARAADMAAGRLPLHRLGATLLEFLGWR